MRSHARVPSKSNSAKEFLLSQITPAHRFVVIKIFKASKKGLDAKYLKVVTV